MKGKGEYQVDGQNIPIQEGSVIRVAPAGNVSVRCTGMVNFFVEDEEIQTLRLDGRYRRQWLETTISLT